MIDLNVKSILQSILIVDYRVTALKMFYNPYKKKKRALNAPEHRIEIDYKQHLIFKTTVINPGSVLSRPLNYHQCFEIKCSLH